MNRENNYIHLTRRRKKCSKSGEIYLVMRLTVRRYPEIAALMETGIPNILQRKGTHMVATLKTKIPAHYHLLDKGFSKVHRPEQDLINISIIIYQESFV